MWWYTYFSDETFFVFIRVRIKERCHKIVTRTRQAIPDVLCRKINKWILWNIFQWSRLMKMARVKFIFEKNCSKSKWPNYLGCNEILEFEWNLPNTYILYIILNILEILFQMINKLLPIKYWTKNIEIPTSIIPV